MKIPALPQPLDASKIPMDELAGNSRLTQEQKISEAARQFEAILLRQILASTQKPVIPSTFADNSTAAGIYRDMVTSQLADNISKSGTLGLAHTLEREFTRQHHPAAPAGPQAKLNAHSAAPDALAATGHAGSPSRPARFRHPTTPTPRPAVLKYHERPVATSD